MGTCASTLATELTTRPVLRELPEEYLVGIGAVCFQWAQVERALQLLTYGLLQIGPKHGRVAVRSPRATDQVAMIRQLMSLEKLETKLDMNGFAENLGKLERQRDLVAHGIWMRGENGEMLLQDLSGTWRPNPKEPKVSRRMAPEAVLVNAEDLRKLASLILHMRQITEALARDLERDFQTLRDKSRRQSLEGHQPDGRNPDKP